MAIYAAVEETLPSFGSERWLISSISFREPYKSGLLCAGKFSKKVAKQFPALLE
jgi:hypothetical protein